MVVFLCKKLFKIFFYFSSFYISLQYDADGGIF